MEIGRASATDLDGIIGLVGDLFHEQAVLEPSFRPALAWETPVRGFLEKAASSEGYRVLVVRKDARVHGFGMGGVNLEPAFEQGRLGYIADLYVARPARGMGLGRCLVDALLQFFREQGCDNVQLNVLVANSAGVGFWRRCGFAPYMWRMKRGLVDE